MRTPTRLRELGRLQRLLLLLLILAAGIILLILAGDSRGSIASVLREAGIVTIGTVLVSMVYEVALRPEHDAQLLEVVRESMIPRSRDYGLTGIERVDFSHIFHRLRKGDELCWLDTYCPDLSSPDVQDALKSALSVGATIRMLVIDPDCATARARAQEIEVAGYGQEFQSEARHNIAILEGIRRESGENGTDLLQLRTYTGLPCAPIYLRVKDGRAMEGWTSYFLSLPTYQSAHFYWGQPAHTAGPLPAGQGLGLQAFHRYFVRKWEGRDGHATVESRSDVAKQVAELSDSLVRLHANHYDFAADILADDLERLIVLPARSTLSDGKLRRDQSKRSRDLMLEYAAGHEVLLIHSTVENDIFKGVGFWRAFNDDLLKRVREGRIKSVRRLFVLSEPQDRDDPVLAGLIRFHEEVEGFTCRLMSHDAFRAIQVDMAVTSYPVHDFGVYGELAYVWPRQGYARHLEEARGYFQLDPEMVEKYVTLYERLWRDAESPSG
jgi:hypothetical protein